MRCCLLIFLCLNTFVYGQTLHHQMLSSQGKSVVISNGMLVSQSIGQQSAIGNYNNDNTIGQGFQQSNWAKYVRTNIPTILTTNTYPNPFISKINFQFSQPIRETIEITLFDIRGRILFQDKKRATDSILTIELPQLASNNYLVRLTAPNYIYYSQILKQE